LIGYKGIYIQDTRNNWILSKSVLTVSNKLMLFQKRFRKWTKKNCKVNI